MKYEWQEEMDTKLVIFKKNREMENKTRLSHGDYIEFFTDFISSILEKKKINKK